MLKAKVKFTAEHLKSISEYFNLLDDDRDGKLNAEQVAVLYRALGQTISDANLTKIIHQAAASKADKSREKDDTAIESSPKQTPKTPTKTSATSGILKRMASKAARRPSDAADTTGLNAEEFLNLFLENYTTPTNESLLLQAFQVFDTEKTGTISYEKFREILTLKEERMANAEFEEIMRLAEVKTRGEFDYTLFVHKLMNGPQKIRSV